MNVFEEKTATAIGALMDQQIQEMADQITSLFTNTLAVMLGQRDSRYANEIAGLESERENLAKEYLAIAQARTNLAAVLPAMKREAEREADRLMVSGECEKAGAKLAEAEKASRAPGEMGARQREIPARVEAIIIEERGIARRIFQEWYEEVQHVIRATERGFFVTLLNGLERSFYDFQAQTETTLDPMSNPRERGLVQSFHIAGLTSDERSAEWLAGSKWYGGRR